MASFGEKLRLEREMRGVSLREIADVTKISVRFLQALEEDRVDVLPGGLFPRAFVKQYATFLGLDADKLVTDYTSAHGEPPPERRPTMPVESRSSLVTPGQALLAFAALAVVVLALRRTGGEPDRRPRADATAPPVVAAPAVLPTDRVYPSPTALPAAASPRDGLVLSLHGAAGLLGRGAGRWRDRHQSGPRRGRDPDARGAGRDRALGRQRRWTARARERPARPAARPQRRGSARTS